MLSQLNRRLLFRAPCPRATPGNPRNVFNENIYDLAPPLYSRLPAAGFLWFVFIGESTCSRQTLNQRTVATASPSVAEQFCLVTATFFNLSICRWQASNFHSCMHTPGQHVRTRAAHCCTGRGYLCVHRMYAAHGTDERENTITKRLA